ncbi:DDE-type integrase/transposase/recombinase [uncultured Deefgea sp.]|uniref:DDE-type integrase/transposase/recombinase n=1 Tax=uncultured Deefgea sp. TaxID=1304914 RepID=UPI0026029586|nr:DDE-type integrase/transposase/recombinase [uncultured Deefgea sp.]
MSAVINERLFSAAQAASRAGHGGKGVIYQAACAELGISLAKLHRKLGELTVKKPRKQRSDTGDTSLNRDEAMILSGLLMESTRRNGKRLYSIADALEAARANGLVRAEYIDSATGEVRPLSESTIHRALRVHGVHPDQLLQAAPAAELASLHPNHVWQIDASLCVLYYLKNGNHSRKATGLQVMDHATFYKNKPANVAKIAHERVWSYEITDHTSGWIYVEYVLGAESGENLCSVLINAMQERGGNDVLHGVPRFLNMDPGSANTAAMTKNLCKALGIDMLVHKAGSARATGQVENARNIIERKFEPGLKFVEVHDLAELNAMAKKWRTHFNATAAHRRHGMTRSSAWLKIKQDQLIKAPSIEVCRELAVAEPESRKITAQLRVSFHGNEYDVATVPGVMVGEKLLITRNPWRDDAAQVVLNDADGREYFHIVPMLVKGEFGFTQNAAVLGEQFKQPANTPAQTALQEIELLATGTSTSAEAEAARKAKTLPFAGFDPYKHIENTQLPSFMPRRGTEHGLMAPKIEYAPLSHFDAARSLKPMIEAAGGAWSATTVQWLQQRYPAGVPQDEFDAIVTALTQAKPVNLVRVA